MVKKKHCTQCNNRTTMEVSCTDEQALSGFGFPYNTFVSRINSLLGLIFLWDLLKIRNYIELSPVFSLNCNLTQNINRTSITCLF